MGSGDLAWRGSRVSDADVHEDGGFTHGASSVAAVSSTERWLLPAKVVVKRAFDVFAAVIGLIVLAPAFAVIILAIRLGSPGPALFRQERVGRGGAVFGIFKFRTMYDGAHAHRSALASLNESSGIFKIRRDPRVTTIGRLLRRASIDELPQLINVVRGEMSLVGPRPLILEEDELVQGPYRARLQVTPGMTGPWQAVGSVRPPLREMVVIDCLYVENWSLWEDCRILARTLLQLARLRGI
jgi:lipopolysaccharide/colanic/teichoic acid biosynthesis glycosyltransferase